MYGPAFIAIGVFAPPSVRYQELVHESRNLLKQADATLIETLMERDQDEDIDLGQRVRAAFELSDIVVDVSKPDSEAQIRRLVELLFGNVQKTPTMAEYGMALAHSAQARSGSLARQIGAAVLRRDGSVASVGYNEVGRPFGGQYDECDDMDFPKGRDLNRGQDSSDWFRQRALTDVIALLQKNGQLKSTKDPVDLFKLWYISHPGGPEAWLRKAFIASTIDYVRAVHAELGAINDAARNGTSLKDCVMYSTTFPCHDCAKSILAAGISEVVYWAPYPKSLVEKLYDDSISVNDSKPGGRKVNFHSFVGIAPNRYPDFFLMGKQQRKDKEGNAILFDSSKATLNLPPHTVPEQFAMLNEGATAKEFGKKFNRNLDDLYVLIKNQQQVRVEEQNKDVKGSPRRGRPASRTARKHKK